VKSRPAARDLQGGFVAMDPVTGDVYALVGGRDFRTSSFNRAPQAHRQAGSPFKPGRRLYRQCRGCSRADRASLLQQTASARPAASDIVVERVLGPDGVMRVVMRQRR
jgi:hypothetical protein